MAKHVELLVKNALQRVKHAAFIVQLEDDCKRVGKKKIKNIKAENENGCCIASTVIFGYVLM